ncbi:unnamed protein product [Dibothriocephalus latus]|uniref:Uncharacterized protein n=1 Tax=Dibothriocephalus latus TaxID=60516 RepID=A0A3P6QF14_DIBLA|nr:unnamed protein product [Dibothriocephalus latus]
MLCEKLKAEIGESDRNVLHVKTEKEEFVLEGRPVMLSAFSHVAQQRDLPREYTYYNAPKKPTEKSFVYDAVFSKETGFNEKQRRDDRRHDKMVGLHIHDEEASKPIPSQSSSIFGHYLDRRCDPLDRSRVRIQLVESEFFRRNGVEFTTMMEDQ